MNENSSRPQWTAMSLAEFDAAAPNTLAVSPGPRRVLATPDDCGTPALFGEEPRPAPRRRRPAAKPDDVEGQHGLF
ncbi:hypothetical protein ACFVYF_29350 [Streptomyces sp. NPDC058274]|jgi:hypothetical protein|uniref:hypothetical protein n=1 Tax=Streptomyces sp. NPDC058274 TaxID=3346416 RepID=UPI0036E40B51